LCERFTTETQRAQRRATGFKTHHRDTEGTDNGNWEGKNNHRGTEEMYSDENVIPMFCPRLKKSFHINKPLGYGAGL